MRLGLLAGVFVLLAALPACGGGADEIAHGASCVDGIKNADETAIDCGGPLCRPCAYGQACLAFTDCTSGVCDSGACGCPVGYIEDGSGGCEDVDECPAGYVPNDQGGCADVDECALGEDDCAVGATCTNSLGAFTCVCDAGFSGDGRTCSPCGVGTWGVACAESCAIAHCTEDARCDAVTGEAVSCGECAPGYHGSTCASSCVVSGCVGEVTCDQATGVVSACEGCAPGYYGATCQSVCLSGNCTGGVTCDQDSGSLVSCGGCVAGTYGPTCESTCVAPTCEGVVTCAQVGGAVLNCEACEAGSYGSACELACPAGDCVGTMTCDKATGAPLMCEGRCAPGSFGTACDLDCVYGDCVACSSEGECDAGNTCVAGFCLRDEGQTCTANHQCLGVCVDGLCVPPSVTWGPCDETVDCVVGHECVDGSCLRVAGQACDDNELCIGSCYAGICRAPAGTGGACEEQEDCADGHVCEGGLCVLGVGEVCADNTSCAEVCIGGVCAFPSDAGGPCEEPADCLAGRSCIEGACLLNNGQACDFNEECVGVCVAGTCLSVGGYNGACDEDTDCGPALTCGPTFQCRSVDGSVCVINGQCESTCIGGVCAQPSQTFGACEETFDCAAGHLCIGGICLRGTGMVCGENAECEAVCLVSTCGPRSDVGGVCDEIADCAAGFSCIGGRCLFDAGAACTDNAQCIEVCVDLVCQPVSDTGEACDASDDCVANHQCIGGVCLAEAGEPCVDNTSCVEVCVSGTCAAVGDLDDGCDESADCVTGLVCSTSGLCKLAEGGGCTGDLQCATPNTACIGGSCLTDAAPAGISFGDLGCQVQGAEVTSNVVTLSSFYGPLTFTVTGDGSPRVVHNGAVAGASATVRAGDTVALRMNAPSTPQGAHAALATVGPQVLPWQVRTAPNLTPGQVVTSENNVLTGTRRDATGPVFTVPENAVYQVYSYMNCRDRINYGEYHYTLCAAYLEQQNTAGGWASVVGHSHTNGQCCTQQERVLERATNAALTAGVNYRFRYQARPRIDAATTVYSSSANVKFLSCQ